MRSIAVVCPDHVHLAGDRIDVQVAPAAGAELESRLGGTGVDVCRVVAEDDALDAAVFEICDVHGRIPMHTSVMRGDRHHLVLELVRLLPGCRVLLVHEAYDDIAVRLYRRIGEEALVAGSGRADGALIRRAKGRIRARDRLRPRPPLARRSEWQTSHIQ